MALRNHKSVQIFRKIFQEKNSNNKTHRLSVFVSMLTLKISQRIGNYYYALIFISTGEKKRKVEDYL